MTTSILREEKVFDFRNDWAILVEGTQQKYPQNENKTKNYFQAPLAAHGNGRLRAPGIRKENQRLNSREVC